MKYPCLPGLTPDGTVYQNSAMGTVEAMLPPGPWATAHAPALLETPDGSLLCAWFAGSFEGSGDVSIVCARLPKGAARWEAPGMSANPTITGNLLIHTFHCRLKSHSWKRFWDYDTFVV